MNHPLDSRSLQTGVKAAMVAVFLAFTLRCLAGNVADPDLWGYLAFGRLFWSSAAFPYQDVFSFVPTLTVWVYHEWLTGVLFYPLYQTAGAAGLQLLKFAAALATLSLIYATAKERGAHPLAILFLLAVLIPGIKFSYSPVRAQIFTYLFFAWSLYLLEGARRDGRFGRLLVLPVLQLLWANLHGGFLAGLGLILLYALGEGLSRRPWRPYAGILLAAGLATLLNPYGLSYWSFLFRAVTMPRPMVMEWISIFQDFSSGAVGSAPFTAGVLLLCGLFWWRSRWWELTPVLILGVTLVLGLKHIRHLTFFFLAVGGYLPTTLDHYRQDLARRAGLQAWLAKPRVRAGLALGGLVLTLGLLVDVSLKKPFSLTTPPTVQPSGLTQMYYPSGAVTYLTQQRLSGRLLVEFGWGEYLMWLFYPHLKVALDGRFETVYPDAVFEHYLHFYYASPTWQVFLETYRPDLILIKNRGKLPDLLRRHPGWRVLYADAGCILFGAAEKVADLPPAGPPPP